MQRVNLLAAELDGASERSGYRWRSARVGERVGSDRIGASLYELEPGERTFPYHFHHGVEEWLLVVSGAPTLRTPGGERTLKAGDCVCFAAGPAGAHAVTGPGRVLILSTGGPVSISVYPDSDKLGTRPESGAEDDRLNFRRESAVDYWEGE